MDTQSNNFSIKNALRRTFAEKANSFATTLSTLSLAISGLEGDIDDQLNHVRRLHTSLPPLEAYLATISTLQTQCEEASIEENDFTTYTYDELQYEHTLVVNSVAKKLAFLENQLVARDMTNLTPIQLEEFESVFRHFDRDGSNSLSEVEFSAALASLGLVYDEIEMHEKFIETVKGSSSTSLPLTSPTTTLSRTGRVSFEGFIRFMVGVTEDQNTAEQVFQSFREVADGKEWVTEVDLRCSLIPEKLVKELTECMPVIGEDGAEGKKYDYVGFMERIVDGQGVTKEKEQRSPQKRDSKRVNGLGPGHS